ncbi:MAG: T9SS type A sorting domain-containing protein [Bacteroidota bacterium]
MKSKFTLLFILLAGVLWSLDLVAQPAATVIYKADTIITCPGPTVHIFVPITVKNADSIAAFDLVLKWNKSALHYVGSSGVNPALGTGGFFVQNGTDSTGWLASFFSMSTVNLGNSTICTLEFVYKQSWSGLLWDVANSSFTDFNLVTMASQPVNGLVALSGPIVTTQPVSVTIPSNQTASFTISGANITAYQWQSSLNDTNYTDLSNGGTFSGVTTGNLALTAVPTSLDGMFYRCKTTGPCGIQYSDGAKLLVVSSTPVVTTIGNTNFCNGTVAIPVIASDFTNVKTFNLSIKYNNPMVVPHTMTFINLMNLNPLLPAPTNIQTYGDTNLVISFAPNTAINIGNDTLFELQFSTHPGASSFTWDLSNCYYLTPAGSPHFANFVDANLTIIPMPTIPISISGSTTICNDGSSYTYTTPANSNYTSYIWGLEPADAGTITWVGNTATVVFDPTFTQTATVTVKGANSCGESSPNGKFVIVHAITPAILNLLPNVCLHADPLTLTGGIPTNGVYSGPGVYTGTFIADSVGIGTYIIHYTYTNSYGCVSADTTTIKVLSLPSVSFSVSPNAVCYYNPAFFLSGGNPSGGTYSGPGVNSGSGIFTPGAGLLGDQNIKYTVTGTNGCTDYAYSSLHCDNCIGFNDNSQLNFNIQPNPNNGLFEVNVNNLKDDANLSIYNDLGQVVYTENLNPKAGISLKVDLSNQTRGMYFLVLNCKGNIKTDKVILK